MSEAGTIHAEAGPQTVASLAADLRRLGLAPGMTVLLHSSLSALGWVCGGAVAVIDALEAVLGPTGTLMMPAHSSENCDPSHWGNPPVPPEWWETIREQMPPWRPDLSPTRGMGLIPESFRKREGVLRSEHPQVSFCARGPQARALTAEHALTPGFGEASPLGRLCALQGQVLLLGVDHGSNSSLHLAELRAGRAGAPRPEGAAVLIEGRRRWLEFSEVDYDSDDFAALGEAFVKACPDAVSQGRVGLAACQLMSQPALVEFAVDWLRRHRV